ncbi:2-dehydro-3-deoxygluconokinase [Ammoniphilus oxalaticus]|uniref:2-dehydro-3-deoxygluconokinase n=1 Tax=Ammoniphilus oxalaticus TaxID=66863 RepID=A0A419SGN8_9BACL|nr:sugar kinase [Ammoniphilus oxalaticus]RKD22946.1 2-dehydro-3-deoxygluconokinase [Ammoniphilus oxalaticus]
MNQLDVVTFGETMVLLNPEEMLPLEYVHRFQKQIGGAESNVAIGLCRLGHSVGWFSRLGDDPFGRFVLRFIRGEGVDTSRCSFTDQAPHSLLFKEKLSPTNINVYYYRKQGATSLLTPDDLDEEYIAGAKLLHLTGITPALSASCRETVFAAIEMAKCHGVKIVFDPNLRLKLWSEQEAKTTLLAIAEQADYILPGLDEGQFLTGEQMPEKVAAALRQKDPMKTVIIKLGSKGSFYQDQTGSNYVSGFPAPQVVDPIGAGDGFAAGVISGILRGESWEQALRRGNAVGAIVVGANGDVEGLPTESVVEQMLRGEHATQDVKR